MHTTEEMKEIADRLDELQSVENDGRGISHIRSVIVYLRRGDYDSANNVRRVEGDKTRSYPAIGEYITSVFGCSIHSVIDCDHYWCS